MTLGVAILRTRWQPIGGAKIERRRDWPASPRDLLVIVPDLENWPVAEFPMPYAQGFPSRSPSLTRPFSLPPPFLSFPLFRTEEDLYLRFFSFLLYFILFSRILQKAKGNNSQEKLGRFLLLLFSRKWF